MHESRVLCVILVGNFVSMYNAKFLPFNGTSSCPPTKGDLIKNRTKIVEGQKHVPIDD